MGSAAQDRAGVGFRWASAPGQVGAPERRRLLECWVEVSNAGGAVGFPRLPVDEARVGPVLDELLAGLGPHRSLLRALDGAELLGWLALDVPDSEVTGHRGRVSRVQTALPARGRGVGRALMAEVARHARDDLGLDHLVLEVRGGAGTEPFYERLGWVRHGRHPRALRMPDGSLRDELHLHLPLR
ncbi:GNAT family N-acetyltransferase [Paenibacillus sp. TRM 82003]|uniref:GNAT family N-acetyltransferase n=1 Tax=Kineococcus sp. TRM81007 TaxID=2925831 RepID=UPI001F5754E3|nr:GNAT family N-acetyltransferase [Kineococcus sp. TRM81007]MCI2238307.1 GNAT family N-acetyltransferase [Kineococcus sp. TRM81007]MCI3924021.1 GNAT family N-acetyltransferase [Paenibacillus sp. TRM 82003]